ncbi:hypothetical protein O181_083093, partial [Austropuccinia psidii MF-1]|nr:hypothetical protein [Austropuccinia psidii MF-1]
MRRSYVASTSVSFKRFCDHLSGRSWRFSNLLVQRMSFSDLKNRRGQRFDPSNHLKLPPSTSSLAGSMPNSLGHDAIDCFGGHRPQSISSSAALSCRIHVSQASSLPTFSTPSATPAAITSPSSITSTATLDQSYQFNTKLVPFESKNFKPNKFLNICLNQDFPKKGRGLYSKSSKIIKPGTTLLSLSPHVAALETQFLSSRCSSCFLEDKDFEPPQTTSIIRQIKRCAKCKVVAYCGL